MSRFSTLIVVALKAEWSFLNRENPFKQISRSPLLYVSTKNPGLALLQTGLGSEHAAMAFEDFLSQHHAEQVLHIGTCGALNPELKYGDVFLSRSLINTDGNQMECPLAEKILSSFKNPVQPLKSGATLCSEKILKNGDEKKSARQKFLADTVDMESFAVAQICQRRDFGYLNLRGLFDEAQDDLANMSRSHNKSGNLSPTGLAADLMANPKLILKLPEMQRRLGLVQKNLMVVLRELLTLEVP